MVWKFFAPVYDEVMGDWYFKQWKRSFKELVQKHKIKYDLVADVACGSGNALLYFYNKRKKVIGIDNSPEMLEVARRKIGRRKIKLIKMDMRTFKLDEPADLITCNFNALNELRSVRDLNKVFKAVYNNLESGGWGVFDMISVADGRSKLDSDPELFISKSQRAFTILPDRWYGNKKNINTFFYNFVKEKRNLYRLYKARYSLKTYFLKDLRCYLKKVGFKIIFAYSWAGLLLPAKECDTRFIFAVRK